jgi:hypothetical protein
MSLWLILLLKFESKPVLSTLVYAQMLNDLFLLQNLSLLTLGFFVSTYNILTLWYLAGIYLVLLGFLLMLDDGDIFIGFL